MAASIGELLVRERVVSAEQIVAALAYQKQQGGRLGDALVALGAIGADALKLFFQSTPAVPYKIAQTGLSQQFLLDLMLRIANSSAGTFTLLDMSQKICLPMSVVDELIDLAKVGIAGRGSFPPPA